MTNKVSKAVIAIEEEIQERGTAENLHYIHIVLGLFVLFPNGKMDMTLSFYDRHLQVIYIKLWHFKQYYLQVSS